MVGGSIHAGRHHEHLLKWLRHHHVALGMPPSALFSVSLAAADDTDEARAATRELIDELVEGHRLEAPAWRSQVAGALEYREYDPPPRVLMRLHRTPPRRLHRRVARQRVHPTGTPSSASRSGVAARVGAGAPRSGVPKRRLAAHALEVGRHDAAATP